ncbi:MAG: DNA polymerase III subunit gamma/tau [Verrucomicrobia bacterium]|nr:DNA polymerase III subunit gamma/tau [Verrucomicrobiota bacterium]
MGKKYQVLARKYRPQRFADVVGQEAVLTTLKNALRFDQAAHAYLFCGSRGVGKTTLARLFAKALNCPNRGADLEPCNQCPSCQEISSGQSLDVIEIDGASNRGIDDIRQINETVGYAPSHGKYKIYIIDEVHMLTKEAFNALLKTLEEPPEQAKFFFATTEPHKVLPTIISRCQRFDLLRINAEKIADKLGQIARDLNRTVEPEALHLIASFADGSLRDAESLFDQILCYASSETVKAETVRQALGLIPQEHFFDLDTAFAECRLPFAFELVELLFQAGKDLTHFLQQLIEHYRRICLCKTLGDKQPQLSERYAASARLYTQAQSLYILDTLIAAEQTMQKSPFPRVTLETTLLHLIRSKNRIPLEVIVRRLSELEQSLKTTEPASDAQPDLKPVPFKLEPAAPAAKAESVFTPVTANAEAPSVFPAPAPIKKETAPASAPSAFAPPAAKAEAPSVFAAPVPIKEEAALASEPSVFAAPAPIKEEAAPLPAPSVFAPPPVEKEEPTAPPSVFATPAPTVMAKHPSHYETLMRFAAVELEGTLKT